MSLGVSAYGQTPHVHLPDQVAHHIHKHDAATQDNAPSLHFFVDHQASKSTQNSDKGSSPLHETLLQLAMDDHQLDLPDLLDLPPPHDLGNGARQRTADAKPVTLHSPSLKRRPKPPRVPTTQA